MHKKSPFSKNYPIFITFNLRLTNILPFMIKVCHYISKSFIFFSKKISDGHFNIFKSYIGCTLKKAKRSKNTFIYVIFVNKKAIFFSKIREIFFWGGFHNFTRTPYTRTIHSSCFNARSSFH